MADVLKLLAEARDTIRRQHDVIRRLYNGERPRHDSSGHWWVCARHGALDPVTDAEAAVLADVLGAEQ